MQTCAEKSERREFVSSTSSLRYTSNKNIPFSYWNCMLTAAARGVTKGFHYSPWQKQDYILPNFSLNQDLQSNGLLLVIFVHLFVF